MYVKLAILAAALYGLYLLYDTGYINGVNAERVVWLNDDNEIQRAKNKRLVELQKENQKIRKEGNQRAIALAKTYSGTKRKIENEKNAALARLDTLAAEFQLQFFKAKDPSGVLGDGGEGAVTVTAELDGEGDRRLSKTGRDKIRSLIKRAGRNSIELAYDTKRIIQKLHSTQDQLYDDRLSVGPDRLIIQ